MRGNCSLPVKHNRRGIGQSLAGKQQGYMVDILRCICFGCCMWLVGYSATELGRNAEDCMRLAYLMLLVGRLDDGSHQGSG